MAGLVDYAAVVVDLRGRLLERPSWGAPQLRELIDELEQAHRIDESADAATLRRFGDHLTETVLDLLPPATPDPLFADDRLATSAAMDAGADTRSHQTEVPCPPIHSSPPPAVSRTRRTTRLAPAAT